MKPEERDAVRAALAELVVLKDLKDALDAEWRRDPKQWTNDEWRVREQEYARRKPLAWEAARAALTAQSPAGVPPEPMAHEPCDCAAEYGMNYVRHQQGCASLRLKHDRDVPLPVERWAESAQVKGTAAEIRESADALRKQVASDMKIFAGVPPEPESGGLLDVTREFRAMQAAGCDGWAHEDGWTLMATVDAEALKRDALAYRAGASSAQGSADPGRGAKHECCSRT